MSGLSQLWRSTKTRYSELRKAILSNRSSNSAQTEPDLRDNASFFRQMFEVSPAVKIVVDPLTAQIVEANPAACAYYGYTLQQFKLMRISDLARKPLPQILADMRNVTAQKNITIQEHHRLASGEIRNVEIFLGVIDVAGKHYLYADIQDVTGRFQAEAGLRYNEALYRTIAQHMPNTGVLMFDTDMRYTLAEGEFFKRFGSVKIVGNMPQDVLAADSVDFFVSIYKRALEGESFTFERLTDDYAYKAYVAPIRNDSGQIIGGMTLNHDMTETKSTEKALHHYEALYKLVTQHMPNTSVVMFDNDMRYTLSEGNFLKSKGFTNEVVLGKTAQDVFDAKAAAFLSSIYQRALQGEAFTFERVTDQFSYEAYVSPVTDANGQIVGGITLNNDISERIRAEKARHETKILYQLFTQHMPHTSVVMFDIERRFTLAEGELLNRADLDSQDMIGKLPEETFDAETLAFMQPLYDRILNGEAFAYNRSTPAYTYQAYATPLKDAAGKIIGGMFLSHDITDLKRSEEALRASEERFHSLVDLAPVGIIQTDIHGKRIFCNTHWCEMTGITLEQALSDEGFETIYAPDLELASGPWDEMMATGLPFDNAVFRYQKPDKSTVWVSGNGRPIYDSQGIITGYLGSVTDISERKQLEDALITSESRFRSLIDIAPVGIVETDVNGAILLGNEYWSKLSSVSEEHALLNNAFGTLHPDDFERVIASNQNMLETVTPVSNIEYRFIHPDGKVVWVSGNARPLLDADDVLTGYIVTMSDITERKLLENALTTSESRFRTLIDFAPVGIVETDNQGILILGNAYWYTLSGISPHRAYVANGSETLHPEDLPRLEMVNQSMVESGKSIDNLEYRFLHPDGKVVWVSDSSRPLTDSDGTVTGFIVALTDITERKRLEDALRENEERLQNITDNLEDLISQSDGEGKFVFVSPSYGTVLGYETKALIGRSALEHIHPDDLVKMVEYFRSTSKIGSQQYHVEARLRHADGHYISVETVGKLFFDNKSNFAGGIFVSRDISERKRMQNLVLDKEKLQTALDKELELNDLKTRMMNRIAHEFRTPLTVIQAATETLTHYLDRLTAEQRDAKEVTIKGQIQRLVSMLDEIARVIHSDFTPDKIRRTSTDVSDLCRQIALRLERELKQPDKFVLDLPEKTDVLVDPQILSNAFMHVMQNAARFSKPDAPVQVTLSRAEASITLRVTDTGIGILSNEHPRIFEPFFRGNNIGESSGLGVGLTITRAAIEAHSGTIKVDSEVGKGTTVTIWLPV